MANTLGNPTTIETDLREQMIITVNGRLNVGGGANAILRIRRLAGGPTTLVDFPLDATNPITAGASDGAATLNPVSSSAVATGGSATLADNYQILDKAGTVRLEGPASSTDGITSGQTVNLGTITLNVPAP